MFNINSFYRSIIATIFKKTTLKNLKSYFI